MRPKKRLLRLASRICSGSETANSWGRRAFAEIHRLKSRESFVKLTLEMMKIGLAVCIWFAVAHGLFSSERPYFNDLKAPRSLEDFANIEKALQTTFEQVRPAVVCLDLGDDKGSGSGVIVSPDGLILTAAHVSMGVERSIEAIFEDGSRKKVRTLGLVADSDAAMAQIEDEGPFPYVEVDRENSTLMGDWVMALGHSGGFDEERGVVLRLGRLVRMRPKTWQSDGTLIGGDSGGPLFDLNGRLIGIHSRVGKTKGENLHVPMEEFLEHWDEMLAAEFVGEGPFAQRPRGFLGIEMAKQEALEDGEAIEGVLLENVIEGTAAEKAGLQNGDVILELDGQEVTRESLVKTLAGKVEGDSISVTFLRGEEIQTVELELGGRPE